MGESGAGALDSQGRIASQNFSEALSKEAHLREYHSTDCGA
jgi:hypothetical protein